MVTVFLIAIMMGLVLPAMNLGKGGSNDLDRAINRIRGAIDEARSRTILTRQAHQLLFYANRVVLLPERETSSLPGRVQVASVEVEGESGKAEELPRVLPFHPRGYCAKAAIVLKGDSTTTLLVRPFLLDQEERSGTYSLLQLTGANSAW